MVNFPPLPVLTRIPLLARMIFYCLFFLAFVLGLLPWLAYRLDVHFPGLHVEIGGGRAGGWVVFAAFLAVYLYCSYQLITRGRGAYVEFDPPTEFVAQGPYRWVRNPIAACVVGMVFGLAVALSSTGILLLALIGVPLAHAQVVLLEEPLLRKRFGAAYENYLRRVPRWIPRRPAKDPP
ncbi:MAG: isoprenylcysteine carboxylmethyltransferase family protein [Planctomycetes bacterium]|nr:isoprenylcysteine carboxylmethyltransferase family protein [Planctomycetota bacterium]